MLRVFRHLHLRLVKRVNRLQGIQLEQFLGPTEPHAAKKRSRHKGSPENDV